MFRDHPDTLMQYDRHIVKDACWNDRRGVRRHLRVGQTMLAALASRSTITIARLKSWRTHSADEASIMSGVIAAVMAAKPQITEFVAALQQRWPASPSCMSRCQKGNTRPKSWPPAVDNVSCRTCWLVAGPVCAGDVQLIETGAGAWSATIRSDRSVTEFMNCSRSDIERSWKVW